jgi:hypothetical protein
MNLTKYSENNLRVIQNFLLYVGLEEEYSQAAFNYVKEDHVDGEGSPEALIEQKKPRVYVLNADDIPDDFNMSGHSIVDWVNYEEQHGKLTDEAERFITLCEEVGNVYSLYGFLEAFNVEEMIGMNDFVFITRAY